MWTFEKVHSCFLSFKAYFFFPYNQYKLAPFLVTGKALVQYMAISFSQGVKPLISSAIKWLRETDSFQNINHKNLMDIKYLIQ